MVTRFKNIKLFGWLLLMPLLAGAQRQTTLPNILIILTDDLGYHDVSYYGTPDISTPNIDALCNSGMRFDNFYATPVCSPSRAALMSGRYPDMVGVPGLIRSNPDDSFGYLIPGVKLLPALLKPAGYRTAIIGKWNLGLEPPNLPNQKGFDYFHGFLEDMMDDYYTHLRFGKNFMRENTTEVNPKGHATDIFTNWAIDYLNRQKKAKTPFFLYLAYNAPHAKIQPPADWLAKVKAVNPALTDKRAKLVALIEHLDSGIGQVMRTLKNNGQEKNTIVIFLSDNGGRIEDGANNGPLHGGKGNTYEGGIRVPAVFVWPDHIQPESQTTQRAHLIDIYPTLAAITGVKIDHKIDGLSFLKLLENTSYTLPDRPLFFTRREGKAGFGGLTIQAIIAGKYKLLQNTPYTPFELYNLQDDPYEKNNLSVTERKKHAELQLLLLRQIQKSGSVPWQKPVE